MYLWVAIGSALGGMARYGCSEILSSRMGAAFPWDTLIINILGSFAIGFLGALSGPNGRMLITPEIQRFTMVGFCGGYTTFSSFSLQTFSLLQEGQILKAMMNSILSVALCLVFVWLGYLLGKA